MDLETAGNLFEATLWGGMGLIVGILTLKGRWKARRRAGVCAITLILFGISDLVESQTGAWWRPWWLLVWKGLCLVVFAGIAVMAFRGRETKAT